MSRPTITCTSCSRQRPHKAHGWCTGCYMRWDRAGRPDTGPPAPPQAPSEPAPCTCCGRARPIARGWCRACYMRWLRAGKPAGGPPAPRPAANITYPTPAPYRFTPEDCAASARVRSENRQYRISEYAFLISCGETPERAAQQLGISVATARDYDKALADQREHYQEAA